MNNITKRMFLTQIFIFAIFFLIFSPVSHTNAEHSTEKFFLSESVETVTVNYYFEETLIQSLELNKGTTISLPDIAGLKYMLEYSFPSEKYDFQSKSVVWHVSSCEGDIAENEFSAESDTNLYAAIISTTKTITFELIYDYFSASNYKTKNYIFDYGETIEIKNIDGMNVEGFYKDPFYKQISVLPDIAVEDKTFFVKFSKFISYTLNGETFNARYGTPLDNIKETETYIYEDFYLDEEHKEKYVYTLLDGLVLHAEKTRTAYVLTVRDDSDEENVYVPLNDNTILKSALAGNANKYYYCNGTEVEFPLKVEKDVVIYTKPPSKTTDKPSDETDSMKNSLSENDVTILIIVCCVLGFAIIASVLYEKVFKNRISEFKTKKKRKK